MSDYEKGRQTGLTGGWDPHADIAGQLEGQRQREQQDAAWRNRNSGGGGSGGGSGPDGGAGLVVLMAIVGGGVLIFTYRFALLSLVYAILLAAGAVFAARRVTAISESSWGALRSAALAYLVALTALALALFASRFMAQTGVNLTPGLELFTDHGMVISTGPQSFILPIAVWIVLGAWWLNRSRRGTAKAVAIRWAAALATMAVTPVLGVQLARATFSLF